MIGFFNIDKFKDLPIVFGDKDNLILSIKLLKVLTFHYIKLKDFIFGLRGGI